MNDKAQPMIGFNETSRVLSGRRNPGSAVTALIASLWMLAAPNLQAQVAAPAQVNELLTEAIAEYPGHELTMSTVTYPPGGESKPHRHDAYIFVYVLKGAVEMKVRGRPSRVVHSGETFVEKPADIHEVSRNASPVEPATFLVIALKSSGKSLTVPVTSP